MGPLSFVKWKDGGEGRTAGSSSVKCRDEKEGFAQTVRPPLFEFFFFALCFWTKDHSDHTPKKKSADFGTMGVLRSRGAEAVQQSLLPRRHPLFHRPILTSLPLNPKVEGTTLRSFPIQPKRN